MSDRASRLAIVGFGKFGRTFAQLARAAGMSVSATDSLATVPDEFRAESVAQSLAEATYVMLAVPLAQLEEALRSVRPYLRPDQLVLDACGTKLDAVLFMTSALGTQVPWVATHPLFGPMSVESGKGPLRVVLCPNPLHPGAVDRARALFERLGLVTVEQDPEAHDRAMAETHAIAFFIAEGLWRCDLATDHPWTPPSFDLLRQLVNTVQANARHVVETTLRAHPGAATARRRLMNALSDLDDELGATALADERRGVVDDVTAALADVRGMIDDVDRELVGLLARRAALARRVAHIKARRHDALRDPAREAAMLTERHAWAEALGLEPAGVEEVFHALLAFSRRIQAVELERADEDGD